MKVVDCLAGEIKAFGIDALSAAALCGKLGGNILGYYIFEDDETVHENKKERNELMFDFTA